MTPALKVENLVKDYGRLRAVNHVSFEVAPGEIFGLLGPNGAGKTSIISVIVTLEKASTGKASVFGHDVVTDARQAKVCTGLVPQEIINHGFFSVEEVLHFISGFFGRRHNRERIDYLLHRLALWDHKHKKVKELSGGMKRRLMIAKALVHQPKLLLLDEPTAGVDIELRATLWEFVKDLKKEGVSILLTTHYLEEAEHLCDRVAILHKGQILKSGLTRELVRDLTTRTVRFELKQTLTPISHPLLVNQSQTQWEFCLPSAMGVGELLASLRLDPRMVQDIQIIEGDLEDAFRRIVKEGQV
ncbi:MAG: ABC transporter ATP-binding protein [Bdellovibrionales bacterium]